MSPAFTPSRFGASDLDQGLRRTALSGPRTPGTGRESPGIPSSRAIAVASVGAAASVAVSSVEPTVIDARSLLTLGLACRRAAMAFAVQSAALGWSARSAGRIEPQEAIEAAQHAFDMERAAEHLQAEAQDAELLSWLAHRAAGGSVILVAARPVVVARDERAPEAVSLVQRLGRAVQRLPVFRRAA